MALAKARYKMASETFDSDPDMILSSPSSGAHGHDATKWAARAYRVATHCKATF